MKLRMNEYYRILSFLKSENIDRIYPAEEYFLSDEGEKILFTGDSFLFKTNHEQFTGLDYVEILLESKSMFNISDLKLNISEYTDGYDPVEVLSAEPHEILTDTPMRIIFKIRKSMSMTESSRNLTNIRSIELITPNNSDFTIHEICFRDNNALYSLESMDNFYESGKYYVLSRLHMSEVPEELQDHVYTASAGYAWTSVWEYEARVMNDEQKNALSYGKWLFAQVDKAIDLYKAAHGIADDEELFVKGELVTSRKLLF